LTDQLTNGTTEQLEKVWQLLMGVDLNFIYD